MGQESIEIEVQMECEVHMETLPDSSSYSELVLLTLIFKFERFILSHLGLKKRLIKNLNEWNTTKLRKICQFCTI